MFHPPSFHPPLGQVGFPELPDALAPYSDLIADVAVFSLVTVLVYLFGRLLVVPSVVRVLRARNRNNPTLVSATETYLGAVFAGFGLLAGLAAVGQARFLVNTDSAILLAALTFAFGVAGQEVLGSLVSGLFLVADPDFNVGDWISWPGGEGTVEAVDFRVTRIRTVDNETVTVPNTELTTNALTRPFGRESYRIREQVFVDYAEDTERALMELRAVATAYEGVMDEPAPTARVVELGENSITVRAAFWIDDPERAAIADVRSEFRRRVKRRFDEEDITIAPPSAQHLSGSVAVAHAEAGTEGRAD